VRVVPRVERDEFVNVGAIVFCRTRRFLRARIELDRSRLVALAPWLDVVEVERHLATIPLVCAGGVAGGPIGLLPQADRFHWLVAPRSAMIQTSPVHAGLCHDPAAALEEIVAQLVRPLDSMRLGG
jgi:Protein of unknown function (DUF3037)